MKKESTYHDTKTGKFVSKKYAKENPDKTTQVSEINIKQELIKFAKYMNVYDPEREVDAYLANKDE